MADDLDVVVIGAYGSGTAVARSLLESLRT